VLPADAQPVGKRAGADGALNLAQQHIPRLALQGLGEAQDPWGVGERPPAFGGNRRTHHQLADDGIVYSLHRYCGDGLPAGQQQVTIVGTERGIRDEGNEGQAGAQFRKLGEQSRLGGKHNRVHQPLCQQPMQR
jgi:hypothetical protein